MVPIRKVLPTRGARKFVRKLQLNLGTRTLQYLHKQIGKDAKGGASQVANALGQRHGE